jgi:hypothetical protein
LLSQTALLVFIVAAQVGAALGVAGVVPYTQRSWSAAVAQSMGACACF